jgi:hypothetical protein
VWGITFSKKFAEELEIPWKEAYLSMLDDLGVDNIRIPIYWDDIASTSDAFIVDDYHFMVNEAEKRNHSTVLAVGARLPRWPECHIPVWAEKLSEEEYRKAILKMIENIVKEFKDYESITAWQVENEPLVSWFGECKKANISLIKEEINLVRSLDGREIIITDSGEMGKWRKTYALGGDILGITTYRVTWNSFFKYFRYPFPPSYYRLRAKLAGVPWKNIKSMELQAEPWPPGKEITKISKKELYKSFEHKQFKAHIEYAKAMEVSHAYLWGAEWWYWLKIHGNDSMWEIASSLWQ